MTSSRLSAVRLMLGFACAGLLLGCEDRTKPITLGKDASLDNRAGDKDVAVMPDTNLLADTVVADAGSDSGPDAEPGKKDVAAEDASVAGADAAPDIAERRDSGSGVADSSAERAASSDGRSVDTGLAAEAGKPTDGPAGTDSKPGIDSKLPASCQGILLDNTFMPPTYPVLYREPSNAADLFATRSAALLSGYGLDDADYTFDAVPVSWAAELEQGTGPCALLLGGPPTDEAVLTTVRSFLSRWGDLFQYKDNGKELTSSSCDSKFCRVRLAQDYCGLTVRSTEQSYGGTISVDVYAKDGCLWRAISYFVPMIPIPGNVLLSEEKLKQAVIGLTLKYSCDTGQHTAVVSETDSFTMPAGPIVVVSKSTTQPNTLEYRLAVGLVVEIGGSTGLAWTIYVDGIDGTVISSAAGFICG